MTLAKDGSKTEISGGAIIVATGARKAEITEYMCGKSERVMTRVELEKQLHKIKYPANENVIMIQCVS